jgi:hypothetical protein
VEKEMVQPVRTHANITRRVRFACWITEATNARSEYIILLEVRKLNAEHAASI